MLLTLNKWSAVFAVLMLIIKGEVIDFMNYCIYHPQFI